MRDRLFEIYDEIQDAVCTLVKIDHGQILKVVIRDLRSKRKHLEDTKHFDEMAHFDYVLKYYLGDEDFEKYVVKWSDIEP